MIVRIGLFLFALVATTSCLAADSLRLKLEDLLERDQRHRGKGYFEEGKKLQDPIDKENIIALIEVIEKHDWPKISEVGEDAALGAFLVLQHADLVYQERYLPLIFERFSEGEAKGAWVGLLTDRIKIRHGKPQLYGTQSCPSPGDGRWILCPMEDPSNVNSRRQSLGMRALPSSALVGAEG